jgi:threonine/homoserine/homoserine lactone efflux protein
MMPASAKLIVFLSAAFPLAIAPGPGMLYVLSRSLAGGRREGILSALGTLVGGLMHVFAAAVGISIILAQSALAFAAVKYAGAGYLCFLGVRMIMDACSGRVLPSDIHPTGRRPFWQGIVTEALNPKTALFFLSFLPQFVDHRNAHAFLQFVLLGTVSVFLNTSADLAVITLAGPLGERIRSSVSFRQRQRTVTGFIMIGLGTYLVTSDSR